MRHSDLVQMDGVLAVYRALDDRGVAARIDGGWCVDALLGRQTRDHADLDLAVDRAHEPALLDVLGARGYRHESGVGANVVLADDSGNRVDVHGYVFDEDGELTYGIAYPPASLTGTGTLGGVPVRCIDPRWMLTFKTGYPPRPVDLADVRALAAADDLPLPDPHAG